MSLPTQGADHDGHFPPTAWTVLLAARDPAAPEARPAREAICTAYWRPVFRYLRMLGLGHEEAEDTTQTLLTDLCAGGGLDRVDQAKGQLRHFLKSAARHALSNHRRRAETAKRGGGQPALALEDVAERELPTSEATPEAAFDREWAWTLFDRAMRALEEAYAARGKTRLLETLKPALISDDELPPYAEIATAFGVGERQISLETHRLRRRLAEALRAEVAATMRPGIRADEVDAPEKSRYLAAITGASVPPL